MRIAFGYLPLVFVGALLYTGCALPPDPPAHQTLGPALEQSGVIEQPKPVSNDTLPKELTPEEKQAAEVLGLLLTRYNRAAERRKGTPGKTLREHT